MKKQKQLLKSKLTGSLRFPTPVGLITLIGFFLGLHFLGQQLIWSSKAGGEAEPKEVKITNIDSGSFTVSWQTDQPSLGTVKLILVDEVTFVDKRELEQALKKDHYTHYVVVDNLNSNQEYSFLINSNGRFYGQENRENGKPRVVKTASLATEVSPEVKLAYGQVVDTQGGPVAGVLVYLNIPQVAFLSSLTSESGYWMIPFAFAYDPDLNVLADYQEGPVEEEILAEAGPLGRSVVLNITRNNRPVPPITLGQDSDFRELNGLDQPLDSNSSGQGGQFPFDHRDYQAAGKEFSIINPEEDEGVATFRPEIFGTLPLGGGRVEVVIESEVVYQGEAQVDEGFWRYSPSGSLEPGEHTLTATFIDVLGQKQSLVRKFVVLAAEGEAAFTSTPSGQVSPTSTIIPSVTPVPTLTPTPTMVIAATNTPAPSPAEIPQTGFGLLTNPGLLAGGVVLIAGLFLIFVF
ncbi:fibronectin type III domain-containing protein [Candidatus Shapirobacteria bacterium]|nr:fibronectin type III domain-containing protein [Candidatus Shapirobacteria bacterium]